MEPSSEFHGRIDRFLMELRASLQGVNIEDYEAFRRALEEARRVAVFGIGRCGEILRTFASGLTRSGRRVDVMFTPSAQSLDDQDLLLLASTSGKHAALAALAEEAGREGVSLAVITATALSPLSRLANVRIVLPPLLLEGEVSPAEMLRPLGLRFEQALLLVLDALALDLEEKGRLG